MSNAYGGRGIARTVKQWKACLAQAQESGSTQEELDCLHGIGDELRSKRDFSGACKYHGKALKLAQNSKDAAAVARARCALGCDYNASGDRAEGISQCKLGYQSCCDENLPESAINCLVLQGQMLAELANSIEDNLEGKQKTAKQAVVCLENAHGIFKRSNREQLSRGLGFWLYLRLGCAYACYTEKHQREGLKQSERYLFKAVSFFSEGKEKEESNIRQEALCALGMVYTLLHKHKEALQMLHKCEKLAEKSGYAFGHGNCLNKLGQVYYASHKYERALHHFECAAQVADKWQDVIIASEAESNVALARLALRATENVKRLKLKCASIQRSPQFNKTTDLEQLCRIWVEIASEFFSLERWAETIEYAERMLALAHSYSYDDVETHCKAYDMLDESCAKLELHEKRAKHCRDALRFQGSTRGKACLWQHIAEAYEEMNDTKRADQATKTALGLARKSGSLQLEILVWTNKQYYCKIRGNLEGSQECEEQMRRLEMLSGDTANPSISTSSSSSSSSLSPSSSSSMVPGGTDGDSLESVAMMAELDTNLGSYWDVAPAKARKGKSLTLRKTNRDTMKKTANELIALNSLQSEQMLLSQANEYNARAVKFFDAGQYEEAQKCYNLELEVCVRIGNLLSSGKAQNWHMIVPLHRLGECCLYLSDYRGAIAHFTSQYRIAQALQLGPDEQRASYNLGRAYYEWSQANHVSSDSAKMLRNALRGYRRALQLAENLPATEEDKDVMIRDTCFSIGHVLIDQVQSTVAPFFSRVVVSAQDPKIAEALTFYERAQSLALQENDTNQLCIACSFIADAHVLALKFDQAIQALEKMRSYVENFNAESPTAPHIRLAQVYIEMREYGKALEHLGMHITGMEQSEREVDEDELKDVIEFQASTQRVLDRAHELTRLWAIYCGCPYFRIVDYIHIDLSSLHTPELPESPTGTTVIGSIEDAATLLSKICDLAALIQSEEILGNQVFYHLVEACALSHLADLHKQTANMQNSGSLDNSTRAFVASMYGCADALLKGAQPKQAGVACKRLIQDISLHCERDWITDIIDVCEPYFNPGANVAHIIAEPLDMLVSSEARVYFHRERCKAALLLAEAQFSADSISSMRWSLLLVECHNAVYDAVAAKEESLERRALSLWCVAYQGAHVVELGDFAQFEHDPRRLSRTLREKMRGKLLVTSAQDSLRGALVYLKRLICIGNQEEDSTEARDLSFNVLDEPAVETKVSSGGSRKRKRHERADARFDDAPQVDDVGQSDDEEEDGNSGSDNDVFLSRRSRRNRLLKRRKNVTSTVPVAHRGAFSPMRRSKRNDGRRKSARFGFGSPRRLHQNSGRYALADRIQAVQIRKKVETNNHVDDARDLDQLLQLFSSDSEEISDRDKSSLVEIDTPLDAAVEETNLLPMRVDLDGKRVFLFPEQLGSSQQNMEGLISAIVARFFAVYGRRATIDYLIVGHRRVKDDEDLKALLDPAQNGNASDFVHLRAEGVVFNDIPTIQSYLALCGLQEASQSGTREAQSVGREDEQGSQLHPVLLRCLLPSPHSVAAALVESRRLTPVHIAVPAYSRVTSSVFKPFANSIAQEDHGLQELQLGENAVDDEMITDFCTKLMAQRLAPSGSALDQRNGAFGLQSLEALNLSSTLVTDSGVQRLLEALSPIGRLTSLDLSFTAISDVSLKSLSITLAASPVKVLKLSGCSITGDSIKRMDGVVFGDVFAVSRTLQRLSLDHNPLTSNALCSMFESMIGSPNGLLSTLQALDLSYVKPMSEEKDEKENDRLLAALDRYLNHKQTVLAELKLVQWPFALNASPSADAPSLCRSICEWLRLKTCTLVSLNLSFAPLAVHDMQRVFQGLSANQSLEELYLSGCFVNSHVAGSASAALHSNTSLVVLNLTDCLISKEAANIISSGKHAQRIVQ